MTVVPQARLALLCASSGLPAGSPGRPANSSRRPRAAMPPAFYPQARYSQKPAGKFGQKPTRLAPGAVSPCTCG
jgi:hypothetical protein